MEPLAGKHRLDTLSVPTPGRARNPVADFALPRFFADATIVISLPW
jgi:hypothetical protein